MLQVVVSGVSKLRQWEAALRALPLCVCPSFVLLPQPPLAHSLVSLSKAALVITTTQVPTPPPDHVCTSGPLTQCMCCLLSLCLLCRCCKPQRCVTRCPALIPPIGLAMPCMLTLCGAVPVPSGAARPRPLSAYVARQEGPARVVVCLRVSPHAAALASPTSG